MTNVVVDVNASSGYTDNANSAPSDVAGIQRLPDFFFSVSPGLRLIFETPRLVTRLSVNGSVSRYLDETQANAYSAGATADVSYELAPTWFWVNAIQGGYSDVAALSPTASVGAVPTGGARFATAAVTSSLARNFSASWRGVADLSFGTHVPIGEMPTTARSYTGNAGVTAQMSWKRDAVEARLLAGFNRYVEEGLVPLPSEGDFTQGLVVNWLHEMDLFWGTTLGGGVTLVEIEGAGLSVQPVATAQIVYRTRETEASAALAQNVQGNPLLGQTLATSSATLGIQTGLGNFLLTANAGASHGITLGDTEMNPGSTVDSLHFGASVGWRIVENLYVTAQHEFLFQVTDRGIMGLPDETLMRNTLLLGVQAYFPRYTPPADPLGITLRVRQSEERDMEEARRGR